MKMKHFTLACLLSVLLPLSVFAGGAGQVHYDLGVFALDEGNFVAAEKYFSDAIRQEPDNPYYHHYLGKTFLETKRPEAAVEALEAAWKLNRTVSGLQFDLAMAYYEAGRYAEAEELFADLVAQDPKFILARYYLGMSYFKQDRYGQALSPLLQAGEENESIRDNSYYFAGISHYKTGEPEEALGRLGYVESRATSEKLRESARQWQEVIRREQAKNAPYNIYIKLGLEYDDNVRLDPINEDIFSDESDMAATVYLSWKYKFVNTLSRKLGAGYSHYQSFYQDLTEYNLTAGIASLFYQERLSPEWYVSFNFLPSYYLVDRKKYMYRDQLSPSVLYRFDQSKGVRFSYDFTDDDYSTEKGRSGQGHNFKVDFITTFLNRKGDLTVGAIYARQGAKHPDYEFDLLRAHVEFSYAVPLESKLVLRGILYRKDYDNVDSVNNIRREDDKYSLGLELSRPLFYKWLRVQFDYSYTRNDSNIDYYSYKKNVTGLALVTEF